jgi:uncharacterized membrane protein YfcA
VTPPLLSNKKFWLVFFGVWLTVLAVVPLSWSQLLSQSLFSVLGIIGAVFANSTGAGGGVVFIPFFNQLNFTATQAVATSFSIQCFGMTAGAFTWYWHYKTSQQQLHLWQSFHSLSLLTSISSLIGLWFIYGWPMNAPNDLSFNFSWFSLILGSLMLLTLFAIKPQRERSQLTWFDGIAVILIGLIGGAITAWLSVGVGELLAIYLIFRRFDVTLAVASAVVVSAITVWGAISYHALLHHHVVWSVTIFAGPAAIIGGILAKVLVAHLSARRLKLFFACWLVVLGAAGIF